jgi:enoyl-CoA hydratase/carnithine racemase
MAREGAGRQVIVERRDGAALLVIDNPAKRNALNPDLLIDLIEALDRLRGEDVRALVFRGAGEKSFCSGYDISAIPTRIPPENFAQQSHRNLVQTIGLVEAFPLPTIAMLNGHAWGAGCELATACDLRVSVPEATFGMPPAKLGIIYSPRGLKRFLNLIGVAHTKEMFFTGRGVDAARALDMGLVNHLVPQSS